MYFYIAVIIWAFTLWFSYIDGGRLLPGLALIVGIITCWCSYNTALGSWGIAILATTALVVYFGSKLGNIKSRSDLNW